MSQNALRIALLIDGDNAQPALIEPILEKLIEYGMCVIRRVYGDLTAQNMSSSWRTLEQKHGIQLVHQSSYVAGKNSTDIALTIAAMDILHSGKVNAFCIVSSDSDFTPLAIRLKDEGVSVIAAGKQTTPEAFRNACAPFPFINTDTLKKSQKAAVAVQPKQAKQSAASGSKATTSVVISKKVVSTAQPKPTKSQSNNAKTLPDAGLLLRKAYETSTQKDGWVFLGALGESLRQLDPQFTSKTYGHKGLSQLISQSGDLFDVRTEKGKGKILHIYVKLKT